jgi:hypothetical protein
MNTRIHDPANPVGKPAPMLKGGMRPPGLLGHLPLRAQAVGRLSMTFTRSEKVTDISRVRGNDFARVGRLPVLVVVVMFANLMSHDCAARSAHKRAKPQMTYRGPDQYKRTANSVQLTHCELAAS